MEFSFKCATCDQVHHGLPSFGADAPESYYHLAPEERQQRGDLGSDDCVIDEEHFFVRGCIELPIHGHPEPFVWGVWVSVSLASFETWVRTFELFERAQTPPLFGWLNTQLAPYPDTLSLKTHVHLRDGGVRPSIELEPTNHPLAVEQREGITVERVAEIYAMLVHGAGDAQT
ncbi:DUF2199 domain-containing protein [Achromobacter marplatensis]|uniref:DUF2199 domain-containing protein n=1 Tax=Achromobacter marplatensis TaxID=470868 RepID=A0AA42W9H3_9BURK|nr:DUF2199 domain-containing protein [Achromobacter marplatensis]MDH2051045.1 DUF2199 domain-containing protein [Achromobacter marplatensis]